MRTTVHIKPRPLPKWLSRCIVVAGLTLVAHNLSLRAEAALSSANRPVRIVLVGDSTVTDTAGWGLGFKQFVNEGAKCVNTAVGGRSSMSFIREGRWEKALALKGDYYLIQFGHNDQPGKPGRSTDAETDYRACMNRYVDEARKIGAQPVLVTSLVRREFDRNDPHRINSSLAPYVQVVKEVAAAKQVPLVDLHARSKQLCESLGKEKCLEFSPFKVANGKTNYDGTHLNAEGGVIFARLVVEELRKAVPELAPCLRDEPGPVAPPQIFNVREYGALGDCRTLDTAAIQQALDECGQAGGGIVELPAGIYLSKPIFLRGNTTLRLDAGAILQATDDPEDFADPDKPGAVLAFVNAIGYNAVAIAGKGTIDGAGAKWWEPVREGKRLARANGQTYRETVRRPRMVVFSKCVDVRVEGVTLRNSPSFHLVPRDCENVTIVDVTIRAPEDAPNTDAIDPSACRYVTIRNCLIDVGDDNIAIKSGREDITHPNAACEHISITDCTFLNGHGMSIGSETLGGVRNMVVSNCTFNGTTSGIRIKSARGRGGLLENLVYTDIAMTNVDFPIYLTSYYPKVPKEDTVRPKTATTPVYRNIRIQNVTASGPRIAGEIVGLPECAISNVVFENVHLTAPEGMTVRNAVGVEFRNSTIRPRKGPPLILEANARVEGLSSD